MRQSDEPSLAHTCPRCGGEQVVVDRDDHRLRLACPTCQYEVTQRVLPAHLVSGESPNPARSTAAD